MLAADGIVLASPVYLNQVTAQMKTLLDRTSHFIHCLRLTDKYLAAVTTSGGGGGADAQAFLRKYAVAVGAQFAGGVDASVPVREADLAAARKLGVALAVLWISFEVRKVERERDVNAPLPASPAR